jgi:hypothetical protein
MTIWSSDSYRRRGRTAASSGKRRGNGYGQLEGTGKGAISAVAHRGSAGSRQWARGGPVAPESSTNAGDPKVEEDGGAGVVGAPGSFRPA